MVARLLPAVQLLFALPLLLSSITIVHGQVECFDYSQTLHLRGQMGLTMLGPDGRVGDAVLVGDVVYGAWRSFPLGDGGIWSADVSDPEEPTLLSSLDLNELMDGMEASASHLFASGRDVRIFDISNPAQPVQVGSYNAVEEAGEIALSGSLLFLDERDSNDQTTLRVIDVSNPVQPVLVGSLGSLGSARAIAVQGHHVLLISAGGGQSTLRVIDVSNPSSPAIVGSVVLGSSSGGMVPAGQYVYVGITDNLLVVDISNPAAPFVAATFSVTGSDIACGLSGHHIVLGSAQSLVLSWVDVSNPISPVLSRSVRASGAAVILPAGSDVVTVGGGGNPGSLNVWNFASGQVPPVLARWVPGNSDGISIFDGILAAIHGSNVVALYAVLQPNFPVFLGMAVTGGTVQKTAKQGDLLFAANGLGVSVFDISNLTSPILAGQVPSAGGNSRDIDVTTDLVPNMTVLSVADHAAGLRLYDATTPSQILPLGNVSFAAPASRLFRNGTVMYVATDPQVGIHRLEVVDIADPQQPMPIGHLELLREPSDHARKDNVMYEAAGGWLHVIDVSTASNPVLIRSIGTSGASSIAVDGNTLYLRGPYFGMSVFDISDAHSPSAIGWIDRDLASVQDIAVAQDELNAVFTTNGILGVTGLPTHCPATTAVSAISSPAVPGLQLRAAPNPFGGEIRVSFDLPAPGLVQLTLHDVLGRRLFTLDESTRPRGGHDVLWQVPHGARGRIAPGVYFLRLLGPGGVKAMQKVVHLD